MQTDPPDLPTAVSEDIGDERPAELSRPRRDAAGRAALARQAPQRELERGRAAHQTADPLEEKAGPSLVGRWSNGLNLAVSVVTLGLVVISVLWQWSDRVSHDTEERQLAAIVQRLRAHGNVGNLWTDIAPEEEPGAALGVARGIIVTIWEGMPPTQRARFVEYRDVTRR